MMHIHPYSPPYRRPAQRGVVLVSALLLLIVMTILAMFMFRTNGVQELIAGNIREKQRAIQSAEDAEQYAEWWLATIGSNGPTAICPSLGVVAYSATSSQDSVTACQLADALQTIDDAKNVTTVPWAVSGAEIGFTFYPGNPSVNTATQQGDMLISTTPSTGTYYQVPRFYITLLTPIAVQNQATYQIDAWNWGGTQNTVAVVEGMYVVKCAQNTAC